MRKILIFLLPIIFVSCEKNEANSDLKYPTEILPNDDFYDAVSLGKHNPELYYLIYAHYDECGEWGGHKEEIRIQSDSLGEIYVKYFYFPFSCDSVAYYYDNDSLIKPSKFKQVKLDKGKIKIIKRYSKDLIQEIQKEKKISHAGKVYGIKYFDEINIHLFESSFSNDAEFEYFFKELKKNLEVD